MNYRQGDVLLIRREDNKLKTPLVEGEAVLALGEVTGHSHRIKNVKYVTNEQGLATTILVEQPSTLTHEEHEPIEVPPGVYEVRIQREYDVIEGARQVMD